MKRERERETIEVREKRAEERPDRKRGRVAARKQHVTRATVSESEIPREVRDNDCFFRDKGSYGGNKRFARHRTNGR